MSTKVKKVAKPAAHPPYANMITAAIKGLKDKKGSSRQAILLLTNPVTPVTPSPLVTPPHPLNLSLPSTQKLFTPPSLHDEVFLNFFPWTF